MSGIQVFVLRKDFTLARKRVKSSASHIHYDKCSYFNKGDAILKTANRNDPPVLIFQEGNAIPKTATPKIVIPVDANNPQSGTIPHRLESVKWEAWYIPMLRGLNRERHKRGAEGLGRIFNLKTLPFWIIGLALLFNYLGPILSPAVPPSPEPPLPPPIA